MLRKTLCGTAAALLLLAGGSAADAQFASPIRFHINAGAALPVGQFGASNDADDGFADLGFHVGAGFELRAPFFPVGLRLDGGYDRMPFETADAAYSIWNATANIVLAPPISPLYFIGGVGFYGTDITGDDADAEFGDFETETDFGFNLGVGFAVPVPGFSPFIEARWHRITVDEDVFAGMESINYVPIVFGLRF